MRAVAGELGLAFADTAMSYYEREPRGGTPTTHLAAARFAEFVAVPLGRVLWLGLADARDAVADRRRDAVVFRVRAAGVGRAALGHLATDQLWAVTGLAELRGLGFGVITVCGATAVAALVEPSRRGRALGAFGLSSAALQFVLVGPAPAIAPLLFAGAAGLAAIGLRADGVQNLTLALAVAVAGGGWVVRTRW
jgi:hypothetical protein